MTLYYLDLGGSVAIVSRQKKGTVTGASSPCTRPYLRKVFIKGILKGTASRD
jgi:hypothetical protein